MKLEGIREKRKWSRKWDSWSLLLQRDKRRRMKKVDESDENRRWGCDDDEDGDDDDDLNQKERERKREGCKDKKARMFSQR